MNDIAIIAFVAFGIIMLIASLLFIWISLKIINKTLIYKNKNPIPTYKGYLIEIINVEVLAFSFTFGWGGLCLIAYNRASRF